MSAKPSAVPVGTVTSQHTITVVIPEQLAQLDPEKPKDIAKLLLGDRAKFAVASIAFTAVAMTSNTAAQSSC